MLFLFTAVSAVIPSLLLIWYFWARDAQPEPGRVLWATFGLGVLSIIPVLMIEVPLASLIKHIGDPWVRSAVDGFIGAAAPEEGLKLAVLLLYCERHPAFDEPMDGIVYGSVASLGFATLENVLYIGKGGLGVAALRALTAVPGHAFYGAILGYYVGQAKFFPAHRGRLVLRGYALAVALHGLYDAPLMLSDAFKKNGVEAPQLASFTLLLTLGALLFSWRFVVRQVRRLRVDQLHVIAVRAVQAGVAPPPGVLTAAAPTTGAQIAGAVLIGLGGLLASGGGLVVLAVALGLLFGHDQGEQRRDFILGGAVLAGVPLLLGVWLFASGIRRLRAREPLSPYVARAQR